jgi:hypothetical protein
MATNREVSPASSLSAHSSMPGLAEGSSSDVHPVAAEEDSTDSEESSEVLLVLVMRLMRAMRVDTQQGAGIVAPVAAVLVAEFNRAKPSLGISDEQAFEEYEDKFEEWIKTKFQQLNWSTSSDTPAPAPTNVTAADALAVLESLRRACGPGSVGAAAAGGKAQGKAMRACGRSRGRRGQHR